MESSSRLTALLIDGHNLLYASFFGMPDRIRTRKGVAFTACMVLWLVYSSSCESTDLKRSSCVLTQRVRLFATTYMKTTRAIVLELVRQNRSLSQYRDVLRALDMLGIPWIEEPGLEADDLLGTLAVSLANEARVYIVSRNRDFLQGLITDNIWLLVLSLGQTNIYDAAAVTKKYGISPYQFVDLKAMAGNAQRQHSWSTWNQAKKRLPCYLASIAISIASTRAFLILGLVLQPYCLSTGLWSNETENW